MIFNMPGKLSQVMKHLTQSLWEVCHLKAAVVMKNMFMLLQIKEIVIVSVK